jgi:MFS family permease
MQGFDIVAGGQLAALPEFKKQFGSRQPDGSYIIPARSLSAWNSIAPACEILCTFIYAPLLEKYGRRPGILVASAISAGGILLQQLATDWRVHLAGRGVNGFTQSLSGYVSTWRILMQCRYCDWHDVYYLAVMDWGNVSARAERVFPLLL